MRLKGILLTSLPCIFAMGLTVAMAMKSESHASEPATFALPSQFHTVDGMQARPTSAKLWGSRKSAQLVFGEDNAASFADQVEDFRQQSFDVTYPDGEAVVVARAVTDEAPEVTEDVSALTQLAADILAEDVSDQSSGENLDPASQSSVMMGALVFNPGADNVDLTKLGPSSVTQKPSALFDSDANQGPSSEFSISNTDLDAIIRIVANRYERIDASLLKAVISSESAGDARAVSSKGAMGLMQLMPATALKHGVKDPFDPLDNIMGGTAELAELIDRYEDVGMALAAYNAGEGAVARHEGVPPYDETRDYVLKVLSKTYINRRKTAQNLQGDTKTSELAPFVPRSEQRDTETEGRKDSAEERIERKMGIYQYD